MVLMVKTMHSYNRVVGRSVREHRNRYPYIESRFVRIYRVLIFFLLISHLFVSILFKRILYVNCLTEIPSTNPFRIRWSKARITEINIESCTEWAQYKTSRRTQNSNTNRYSCKKNTENCNFYLMIYCLRACITCKQFK